jgi:hypothetical protein
VRCVIVEVVAPQTHRRRGGMSPPAITARVMGVSVRNNVFSSSSSSASKAVRCRG